MIARLLRTVAIAIALAAVADSSMAISGRTRPRLAIAALAGAPSARVRETLAENLRSEYEVIYGFDATAAGTIVIDERYHDVTLPPNMPVFTVTTSAARRGATIVLVRAPKRVPLQTAVHVEVDVDGSGLGGSSSLMTITSGGVEVGRASHAWRDATERWRAAFDVIPVGEPPFIFRAEVVTDPGGSNGPRPTGEHTGPAPQPERSVADVLVAAAPGPLRVLVYEPRPSWASTFVRRSLEGDARFAVSSLSYASRGIAVRGGERISLGSPEDLANVDVVAVGGLDRLSAGDVRALERFMRERGGSVALLPDGRVDSGPVRELVPSPPPSEALVDARTALTTTPPLPRIDASELLVFHRTPPNADVLARMSGSNDPVVLLIPHGDGRLLFSGALDAWRSRADGGVEFDRFWRSSFAALALAAPPVVDVDVSPPLVSAGETARVSVRIRGERPAVSATLDTGEQVRLWPGASAGVFTGAFVAPPDRRPHTIAVAVIGATRTAGRAVFVVGENVKGVAHAAPLALLAASHGGVNAGPNELPALERRVRQRIEASRAPVNRHPMRSPWWLIPFAASLSGEWWLRRRRGLR